MEDMPTMEAESAMVLDGLAVGVDYLEAIVVFMLSVSHTYASWVGPTTDLKPLRIAEGMRQAYAASEQSLRILDVDAAPLTVRMEHPTLTLESAGHLVLVHRVRTFGVAICFSREAPLGFARMATRQIVATLEQELPYANETMPSIVMPPVPAPTVPGSLPTAASLDFERTEPAAPDTAPPRSSIGDRVRAVVSHLEAIANDPHIVRMRVALRTGLGLEVLVHPDQLNNDALLLIESAAEDILGLDRGKLTELAR